MGRGTDGSDEQPPDAPALRSQHKKIYGWALPRFPKGPRPFRRAEPPPRSPPASASGAPWPVGVEWARRKEARPARPWTDPLPSETEGLCYLMLRTLVAQNIPTFSEVKKNGRPYTTSVVSSCSIVSKVLAVSF